MKQTTTGWAETSVLRGAFRESAGRQLSTGQLTVAGEFPLGAWFFAGHFPQHPVVPGVVLLELMATIAGQFLQGTTAPPNAPHRFTLAEVQRCRFRRLVGPGDGLLIEALRSADEDGDDFTLGRRIVKCAIFSRGNRARVADGRMVMTPV